MLGELAPKRLALRRTEATALLVARAVQLFHARFRWPIAALNSIGTSVLRLVGLEPSTGHEMVPSVEELRLLVTGIVALQDLVEALVGHIEQEPAMASESSGASGRGPEPEGSLILDGQTLLGEFEELVGVRLEAEAHQVDTLGGLVMHRLGRIPASAIGSTWMAGSFGSRSSTAAAWHVCGSYQPAPHPLGTRHGSAAQPVGIHIAHHRYVHANCATLLSQGHARRSPTHDGVLSLGYTRSINLSEVQP